jgi:hypothetical protein
MFLCCSNRPKNGRIANFFWADGQSIMDYACFGAVSFDTTIQSNKFEMPFAPILGTYHHKQTIILELYCYLASLFDHLFGDLKPF